RCQRRRGGISFFSLWPEGSERHIGETQRLGDSRGRAFGGDVLARLSPLCAAVEESMGRPFDRSNVQAIILKPYAYPISRHLIFSIGDKKGARAFVREWVDSVAHGGRDLSATPEPLINI